MTTINENLDTSYLNDEQRKIAEVIIKAAFGDHLEDHYIPSKTFHDPSDWNGEHGKNSELVVSYYDNSDFRYYLSMDGCYEISCMMRDAGCEVKNVYATHEKMQEELNKIGYFAEECTMYYLAVYKV